MPSSPITCKFVSIHNFGKRSLIGNMFVIAITFSKHQISLLNLLRMEGCETFNELQIEDRANKIIDQFDFWVEEIYPREINLSSVYDLEAQNYITCFSHVKSKIDIVYAENFDFSYEDLVSRLSKFTKEPIDFSSWLIDRNTHKKCSVSKAAYILAKFYFNCHIQDLHEKYGDIGTGYLGDKKTENYIVNSLRSGEQNPIIRHSYFELEKLRETIDY